MLLSLLYFVVRRLLRALAPSDRIDLEREVELLVLRHQLKVLQRGVRQPPFCRRDRMLLAAASRLLPRDRWKAFVVTPRTLLRWHGSSFAASGRTGIVDQAGVRAAVRREGATVRGAPRGRSGSG
jgi:hypothetical protein